MSLSPSTDSDLAEYDGRGFANPNDGGENVTSNERGELMDRTAEDCDVRPSIERRTLSDAPNTAEDCWTSRNGHTPGRTNPQRDPIVKKTSVRLAPSVHRVLSVVAAREGINLADIIRAGLDHELYRRKMPMAERIELMPEHELANLVG